MKIRLPTAILLILFAGCKKDCREEPVTVNEVVTAPPPAPDPEKIPDEVVDLARNFSRVFFELDSGVLSSDAKSALDENVRIMQARPDLKLEVQGHADERGTTDYNLSLGQQRAQSVLRYMQATGIAGDRIKVVSYGEERPLQRGSSESAWSQNRRCEFVITWSTGSDIQGTTSE
jgi:peptidoglycan-associated lipoprotein